MLCHHVTTSLSNHRPLTAADCRSQVVTGITATRDTAPGAVRGAAIIVGGSRILLSPGLASRQNWLPVPVIPATAGRTYDLPPEPSTIEQATVTQVSLRRPPGGAAVLDVVATGSDHEDLVLWSVVAAGRPQVSQPHLYRVRELAADRRPDHGASTTVHHLLVARIGASVQLVVSEHDQQPKVLQLNYDDVLHVALLDHPPARSGIGQRLRALVTGV